MPASDLDVAVTAARAGAEVIRAAFGRSLTAEWKGRVNPVTDVDRRSERATLDVIRRLRPTDAILSEEAGGEGWAGARTWIVDPLDGTVNFLHSVPHVGTSVALWDAGTPLVGAVVDAIRGEEFSAEAGAGARLGTERIQVRDGPEIGGALIATGFPYDRQERADFYTAAVARVLHRAQGVRRLGSAALDLCWVAAGRFDAYWEFGLAPWDAAAGVLIVEEAGGKVSDLADSPYRLDSACLVAASPGIHEDLRLLVGAT